MGRKPLSHSRVLPARLARTEQSREALLGSDVRLPGGRFTDDWVSFDMRNKRQCSVAVFCALGVIATGLAGCSNKEPAGKSKEEVAAFAGDPSKMPAAYRERISGQQNAAMAQKAAAEAQKAAANQNPGAAKQ